MDILPTLFSETPKIKISGYSGRMWADPVKVNPTLPGAR